MPDQEFVTTLHEVSHKKHRKEEKSLDELFIKPLLHRQIKGDIVYVPLDLVRLGWKIE